MKKNEFVEIKGLDLEQLKLKVKPLREGIAALVLDKNMKKLKDVKVIAKKKKDLAQILTMIRQKELLAQLESKAESKTETKKVTTGSKVEKEKK
ncbi:50S ribosomal protein L29 [Candidatus Daviesbacteria bacterium]|nr:50S ribosomal protein L29 [Candidatus Daviesbacteria bacterium]